MIKGLSYLVYKFGTQHHHVLVMCQYQAESLGKHENITDKLMPTSGEGQNWIGMQQGLKAGMSCDKVCVLGRVTDSKGFDYLISFLSNTGRDRDTQRVFFLQFTQGGVFLFVLKIHYGVADSDIYKMWMARIPPVLANSLPLFQCFLSFCILYCQLWQPIVWTSIITMGYKTSKRKLN